VIIMISCNDCGLVADASDGMCNDCAGAASKRIAELEAENAGLRAIASLATCVYCGHVGPKDGIADHVMSCDKHLLGQALRENERLEAALSEIAEGRGRFSTDPHEHARNCIEDMMALANAALNPPAKEKP